MSCSGCPQCPREGICVREKRTRDAVPAAQQQHQQHSLPLFRVGFASLSLVGPLALLLLILTLELYITIATEFYDYVSWGSPVPLLQWLLQR